MEDLCVRIPLVAGMILKNLDNQSLIIYKDSSRGIHQYLTEEKLFSIRIIKEYKTSFTQYQNVWEKVLKKASVEIVQGFAVLVREFFFPRFPTDDIYDGRRHKKKHRIGKDHYQKSEIFLQDSWLLNLCSYAALSL